MSKKKKGAIIALFVVLLIAIIGAIVVAKLPKNVAKDVEVTFSGYDGRGTLEYNQSEIRQDIYRICFKKVGLSHIDSTENMASLEAMYSDNFDFQRAMAYIEDVQYGFDKTNNLKNGDKVKFTVKTSIKDSPIKSTTKEFTVKGLTETKKVDIASVLKKYPVKFVGINGSGILSSAKKNGEPVFEMSNGKAKLKNGDKVKLKISEAYKYQLEDGGKILNKTHIYVKVSGLREIKDVPEVGKLLEANDTLIKSNFEDDDYKTNTIEKVESYIRYAKESKYGSISIVTIYKVTTNYDNDDPNVRYVPAGYEAFLLSSGAADIDTKEEVDYNETKDLENLRAKLQKDGFVKYE